MRYSPLVLSIVAALSLAPQRAYAVQCYDFYVAEINLKAEVLSLALVQDANETAFEKCNFYRIMGAQRLKESMSKLNLYVDCPDSGLKVKALLAKSEKFIAAFKVDGEKACADAGISPN